MSNSTKPQQAVKARQEPEQAAQSDEQLLQQSLGFEQKYAKDIQARVDAGLTRSQALDVQRAQVALNVRRGAQQ